MGGPWEDYTPQSAVSASPSAGPWTEYATSVQKPNVALDSLESIPTGLVQGINNIPKIPAGMMSFASGLGAQIGNKIQNNIIDPDHPLSRQQQDQNIQNAQQFNTGGPLDGIGKWLQNTPTFSQLGAGGAASVINQLNGSPLSQQDIEDELKSGSYNPAQDAMHQPQTHTGRIVSDIASAIPAGKVFDIGPAQSAGMAAGSQLADAVSPNNPALQAAVMYAGGNVPDAVSSIHEGVALRYKGATGTMSPDEISGVSDKNWNDADASFKASDAAGAVLTPQAGQTVLAKVKTALGNLSSRHTDTAAELRDFEDAVNNGNLTLSQLNDFRKNFADSASDNTKSKIDGGGFNSDGAKSYAAKQAIQDSFGELGTDDFSQGTPEASSALQEGINQWAKASRFDRVADVISNAEGDTNAIKRGFAKMVKDPDVLRRQGYSEDEISSLQDAATRGTGEAIERGLGTFGLDFGKTKNVALPIITGSSSALVPGIGLPLAAAGTLLRETGKWAARGKAQSALDTINERNTSVPRVAAAEESQPTSGALPPLALPAPKTTYYSNEQGQTVPLTEAGRESIGQSPSTESEQRPSAAVQAQNALSDKARQNYSDHDQAIEQQKAADLEKFANQNREPIRQAIAESAERYKDSGITPGSLGDALFAALKDERGELNMDKVGALLDKLARNGGTLGAASAIGANQEAQDRLNPAPQQTKTVIAPMNYSAQVPATPDISNFSKAESGDNPNAKNPNSSASGLFQFTNKTWADMVARYGKQTGINLGDKSNPQAQATMAGLLAKDNVQSLQKSLGRMPTKGELYAAHVLGASGAAKLINADPNSEAIMSFPRQVFDANRSIFFNGKTPRTVGDVQKLLAEKVS